MNATDIKSLIFSTCPLEVLRESLSIKTIKYCTFKSSLSVKYKKTLKGNIVYYKQKVIISLKAQIQNHQTLGTRCRCWRAITELPESLQRTQVLIQRRRSANVQTNAKQVRQSGDISNDYLSARTHLPCIVNVNN